MDRSGQGAEAVEGSAGGAGSGTTHPLTLPLYLERLTSTNSWSNTVAVDSEGVADVNARR